MEAVERFLNSRGFVATRSIAYTNTPRFTGRIRIGTWRLLLELHFYEGKFDYPDAYLSEWPFDRALRSAFGFRHINDDGKVCYVDQSRTWWDSSMATELVAGCLERIEKVLVDNLAGVPASTVIAQDFAGYWRGAQNLYVTAVAQNKDEFVQIQERHSERQWLVPKGEDSWVKADTVASSNTPWLVLRLPQPPTSLDPGAWPPKHLNQLLEWIHQNSPSSVPQLVERLHRSVLPKGKKTQKSYEKLIGVVLIWPNSDGTDILGCGFSFTISDVPAQAIAHNRLRQAAITLKAERREIIRYSLNRADPTYIQTRNGPDQEPSLKNRRVILVGAGTIGGHLAKLLCAHGAGWGPRGKLHIIDSDIFSVENIGRHTLGARSIGHCKASAVADQLRLDFPHLNIEEHPCSVTQCWDIFTDDCIVIDATGSQTVSVAIPDFLSERGLNPVVLHSWIHGHGLATVAFLNDRQKRGAACFRCLWQLENDNYRPRYPLSRHPEEDAPVFAACHHSYHTYAATTSMIAATQAMTLLYDYLAGQAESTLRFQVLKEDLCQKRPDTTPQTTKNCPLCHRHQ